MRLGEKHFLIIPKVIHSICGKIAKVLFFFLSFLGCPHSLQYSGHFGVKNVAPPFLEEKWQVVFGKKLITGFDR